MKKLGWYQWLLLAVLLLALFVTGLFVVRAVRRATYWRNHRDEPIRSWMNVRYVAHSYRVPAPVLYDAIKLQPMPHDRRPLREIAREQNRPVEALIAELEEAIKGFRAHAPPPSPPKQFPSPGGSRP